MYAFYLDAKNMTQDEAELILQKVVDVIDRAGFIPTVTQQPQLPLAMCNTINVCEVRRKFTRE